MTRSLFLALQNMLHVCSNVWTREPCLWGPGKTCRRGCPQRDKLSLHTHVSGFTRMGSKASWVELRFCVFPNCRVGPLRLHNERQEKPVITCQGWGPGDPQLCLFTNFQGETCHPVPISRPLFSGGERAFCLLH